MQQGQFLLIGFPLLGRPRFAKLVFQLADAIADDLQVGEHQLFAEAAQLIGQARLAVAVEHDEQAAGLAENAEPARIVAPLARQQARRVEELDRRRRRLARLKLRRQPVQTRIGDLGDAGLSRLALGRVRLDRGEPLKQGAFARTGETDDADFHFK